MTKFLGFAAAVSVIASLGGCNTDAAGTVAATGAAIQAPACASLSKNANQEQLCVSLSGAAIAVADAIAQGEIK